LARLSGWESEKNAAAGKEKGRANCIERFSNTFSRRGSRLAQEHCLFPQKLENHIGGAIKYGL
jgi:hypothetical protein